MLVLAQMRDLPEKIYSTSDLMTIFNIGRNTLRLYEERGLLTGMSRTESGYREFSTSHVEELKFILEAKNVGFTLNEIKDLLEIIREKKKMTCGAISKEIIGKVSEIDEQLKKLESKKIFLSDFLKTCGSKEKQSECNVISVGFSKNACCD